LLDKSRAASAPLAAIAIMSYVVASLKKRRHGQEELLAGPYLLLKRSFGLVVSLAHAGNLQQLYEDRGIHETDAHHSVPVASNVSSQFN
jgi:hypothetical protein